MAKNKTPGVLWNRPGPGGKQNAGGPSIKPLKRKIAQRTTNMDSKSGNSNRVDRILRKTT